MKGQHTPGPWGYWPFCCRVGGMVTTNDGGGHVAAPTYYETCPELTKANALLIAADPDLLEALELIAAASMGKTGADARGQLETVKKIANLALAKVNP